MRAILLSIGRSWYAIPIDRVVIVVAAPAITPLPTAPRGVAGLFNLRGEVVPVLAASELLEDAADQPGSHVVVARSARGQLGVPSRCLPVTAELDEAHASSDSPGCLGVFSVDERLVTLIDLDGLLTPHAAPALAGLGAVS